MKKHRYVIYAPSYDDDRGGVIALHRLCDLLNKSGVESCIYPLKLQFSRKKMLFSLKVIIKDTLERAAGKRYKTSDTFTTPLCSVIDLENDVIVYPEIVIGNPLGAKHVVRWLLYEPGVLSGNFIFGDNDLFFYYQKAFLKRDDIKNVGGKLKVIYLQDAYKKVNDNERSGVCYILRKGMNRKIVHDLKNSILVDGLSHEKIAEIFNKSEMCISYDMYTMYSRYAAACGCLSIVVPEPGVDKYQWRPEEELRLGIAYGFDDVEWARATKEKVLPSLTNDELNTNQISIDNFIEQCEMHFFNY